MTDPAPPIDILQVASGEPGLEKLLETYQTNFNTNIIKFIFFTVVLIVILYTVFIGSGLFEITKNWPKYRCNPLVMPFASLFGHDSTENFNYCMKNIFNMNASAVLGPLYGMMANFTDVVGTVSNVANSFRFLIANLLHGMERLMSSFRDRFRDILFSVRLSFMKIQSLMGRLYSTFYAIIYMGLSGLTAANNLANNDLVKFILEFCFDPATPIMKNDGSIVPLSNLRIGDKLAEVNGTVPVVTSVFVFDGTGTKMVRLHDTVVSAKHFVFYDALGIWIEAEDHPDAVPAPSIPFLFCLNTSTHTLKIGETIFSDYDESSDETVTAKVQQMAQDMLNNKKTSDAVLPPVLKNYELGINGFAAVRMNDCSVKLLHTIGPGDIIKSGGRVLGIVRELCHVVVQIPGTLRPNYVSASQLMWDDRTKKWIRAAELFPSNVATLEKPAKFYQLITEKNIIESEGRVYRDYREVSTPDLEEPYSTHLHKN